MCLCIVLAPHSASTQLCVCVWYTILSARWWKIVRFTHVHCQGNSISTVCLAIRIGRTNDSIETRMHSLNSILVGLHNTSHHMPPKVIFLCNEPMHHLITIATWYRSAQCTQSVTKCTRANAPISGYIKRGPSKEMNVYRPIDEKRNCNNGWHKHVTE